MKKSGYNISIFLHFKNASSHNSFYQRFINFCYTVVCISFSVSKGCNSVTFGNTGYMT